MRKFTLNAQLSDTDSGRYSAGATSSDSSFRTNVCEINIPVKINIIKLDKQLFLSVTNGALVCHVKQKILDSFGESLPDGLNYGIFLPETNGKKGKFLEEDRPLSAYLTNDFSPELEFIYKTRKPYIHCELSPVPNGRTKNFPQSLMRYIIRGDLKKIEKLLSMGFDPNFICPKTQETPLSIAISRPKSNELIKILIAGGAHKDFRTQNGMTALHKASLLGNFESVKTLLDFGQSPNTLDAYGLTPLYHNILKDIDARVCHLLLYDHAQLAICDKMGRQEIHQAALLGRTEQINLLIMYGADPNAKTLDNYTTDYSKRPLLPVRCIKNNSSKIQQPQNSKLSGIGGNTPLHFAAFANQYLSAMRLLTWGADPSIKNNNDQTAVDIAKQHGHKDLVDAIRNFRGEDSQISICGPFLPTPTLNPKRKPILSSLQFRDSAITNITELGGTRKGPNRSVTMPFPISPSRVQIIRQRTLAVDSLMNASIHPSVERIIPFNTAQNQYRGLSTVYSSDGLHVLKERASSEGDLLNSHDKLVVKKNVQKRMRSSKKNDDEFISKKEEKMITNTNVQKTCVDHIKENSNCLKNWKSSNSIDKFIASPSTNESNIVQLNKFKIGTDMSGSTTIGRGGNNFSSSTVGCRSMPGPDFRPKLTRAISPRNRESHHFARSPVTFSPVSSNENLSGSFKPISSLDGSLNGSNFQLNHSNEARGQVRVVFLRKAYLPDSPRIPTFGLSLRTVKNASALNQYIPSPAKPSLQLIKYVKVGSPAYLADLQEGDYVIKINETDVTKASHDQVIGLLTNLPSDTVRFEVVRPIVPQACAIPQDTLNSYVNKRTSFATNQTSKYSEENCPGSRLDNANEQFQIFDTNQSCLHAMGRMKTKFPKSFSDKTISTNFDNCSKINNAYEVMHNQTNNRMYKTPKKYPLYRDMRTSSVNSDIPCVHPASDYRIRSQFPNPRDLEIKRQNHHPVRATHGNLIKSNTFCENTSTGKVDFDSYSSIGMAGNYPLRKYESNMCSESRLFVEVPQPPLRFLHHYSPPTIPGSDRNLANQMNPRRRERSLAKQYYIGARGSPAFTNSIQATRRPLSVGFVSQNKQHTTQQYHQSKESVQEKWIAHTKQGSFPVMHCENDTVLAPPEEFCC